MPLRQFGKKGFNSSEYSNFSTQSADITSLVGSPLNLTGMGIYEKENAYMSLLNTCTTIYQVIGKYVITIFSTVCGMLKILTG